MKNQGKFLASGLLTAALVAALMFGGAALAAAQEEVLHSFGKGMDGRFPEAGLTIDSKGNLYGATGEGGADGGGMVFELTPKAGGGWTEKVLHNFPSDDKDGAYPLASLVFDTAGNLYGTTEYGGSEASGTVFELTPEAGGKWTEKVLHSFHDNGKDGYDPEARLILDTAGNVYGTTTYGGGASTYGTVFELTPKAGGRWAEKVLHRFDYNGKDGVNPYAGLILDTAGNLYGTTGGGGAYTYGTVFELTHKAGGKWTEKVLHNFNDNGKDGYLPAASLIFDSAGNLYSTTNVGGASGAGCGGEGCGTVFELTPKAGGRWTEKVLHSFSDNGKDGVSPYAGLIFDAAGNLYGTTYFGGASGVGTAFEIKP